MTRLTEALERAQANSGAATPASEPAAACGMCRRTGSSRKARSAAEPQVEVPDAGSRLSPRSRQRRPSRWRRQVRSRRRRPPFTGSARRTSWSSDGRDNLLVEQFRRLAAVLHHCTAAAADAHGDDRERRSGRREVADGDQPGADAQPLVREARAADRYRSAASDPAHAVQRAQRCRTDGRA